MLFEGTILFISFVFYNFVFYLKKNTSQNKYADEK